MRKIILTTGILFGSLLCVQAQQTTSSTQPTFNQRVEKMLNKLTTTCSLTPDQVEKARPIVAETIKARMANQQQYGSDKAKLKAANEAVLTKENAKINAILNADQQTKLAAYEKHREEVAEKRNSSSGDQQ